MNAGKRRGKIVRRDHFEGSVTIPPNSPMSDRIAEGDWEGAAAVLIALMVEQGALPPGTRPEDVDFDRLSFDFH